MGMFQVRVKVSNPKNPDLHFEEDFWVDTGALYSFVPEDRLHSIKVEPLQKRDLVFADGRRINGILSTPLITIPIINETLHCPVIFAPKNSEYILGTTALDIFCVEADHVNKTLGPTHAIIG